MRKMCKCNFEERCEGCLVLECEGCSVGGLRCDCECGGMTYCPGCADCEEEDDDDDLT